MLNTEFARHLTRSLAPLSLALCMPLAMSGVAHAAGLQPAEGYWCFSGGLYSGVTNLGVSSISAMRQETSACGGSVTYRDVVSCVGVMFGGPNLYSTEVNVRQCKWV